MKDEAIEAAIAWLRWFLNFNDSGVPPVSAPELLKLLEAASEGA